MLIACGSLTLALPSGRRCGRHPQRHHRRHAAIHVAGAGPRRADRSPQRPVQPRQRDVCDGYRQAAVPRRSDAGRVAPDQRQPAAPNARGQRRNPGVARSDRPEAAGQVARRAFRLGRRSRRALGRMPSAPAPADGRAAAESLRAITHPRGSRKTVRRLAWAAAVAVSIAATALVWTNWPGEPEMPPTTGSPAVAPAAAHAEWDDTIGPTISELDSELERLELEFLECGD